MNELKVLVVEDCPEQTTLLRRKFSKLVLPSQFEVAEDAEQTIAFLKSRQEGKRAMPDLILLDLNLPDLPGLDLLKKMKDLLGEAMPPVVIVSATDNPEDKAACYKAGAVCFLPKPYDDELLNSVMVQLRMTGRLKSA